MDRSDEITYSDWTECLPANSFVTACHWGKTDLVFEGKLIATLVDDMEVMGIDGNPAKALADIQYKARNSQYPASFPGTQRWLVLHKQEPVGQLWLSYDKDEIRVLDIVFLSGERNKGFGTILLRALLTYCDARKTTLSLSVEKQNTGALHLYNRLGLQIVDQTPTHFSMEQSFEIE